MSFILLGILNSQATGVLDNYWFLKLDSGSTEYIAGAPITDADNNIYASGRSAEPGFNAALIFKLNPSGSVLWQKALEATNGQFFNPVFDSSGNILTGGIGSGNITLAAKYDTSGSLQAQRNLTGDYNVFFGVASDSSGNLYGAGQRLNQSPSGSLQGNSFFVAKFDSSLNISWQKIYGAGEQDIPGSGPASDDSGNLYVAGFHKTGGNIEAVIVKLNGSNGSIVWQRKLSNSGTDEAYGVHTDGTNAYITGVDSTDSRLFVAKYNSSGTLQWQRYLDETGDQYGTDVTTDSADNVYVYGYSSADGGKQVLAKWNSSGTIQWQRTIDLNSSSRRYGITIDSNGDIVLGNRINSSTDVFLAKLPADGSLTGTYSLGGTSVTYAASSLTEGAGTLTAGTSNLQDATSSLTETTPTYTEATTTMSPTFTGIG